MHIPPTTACTNVFHSLSVAPTDAANTLLALQRHALRSDETASGHYMALHGSAILAGSRQVSPTSHLHHTSGKKYTDASVSHISSNMSTCRAAFQGTRLHHIFLDLLSTVFFPLSRTPTHIPVFLFPLSQTHTHTHSPLFLSLYLSHSLSLSLFMSLSLTIYLSHSLTHISFPSLLFSPSLPFSAAIAFCHARVVQPHRHAGWARP